MVKLEDGLFEIINLINSPVFVFDKKNNELKAVNVCFEKLSGYQFDEYIGKKYSSLFKFFGTENEKIIFSAEETRWVKNKVFGYQTYELNNYTLLILNKDKYDIDSELSNALINIFVSLSECESALDLKNIFLNGIQAILPKSINLIYDREESESGDYQKNSLIDGFPEKISTFEADRCEKYDIWVPGKRVLNVMQRFARDKSLGFLAILKIAEKNSDAFLVSIFSNEIIGNLEFVNQSLKALQKITEKQLLIIKNTERISADLRATQYSLDAINRLMEMSHQGFLSINSQKDVQTLNNTACEIIGYTNAEAIGRNIFDLIGENTEIENLLHCENISPNLKTINTSIHRKNGEAIPVILWINPLIENQDKKFWWIAIGDISEVTELRTMTKHLEHQAEIGRLMATFSHEVRNPINNIATGLQVLSVRNAENQSNLDTINRMQADCVRITDLFESILTYTRPFNAKMEPSQINPILKRVAEKFTGKMKNNQIAIHQDIDATESVSIMADSRSLEQVFTNLISNSIEALMGRAGAIGIKTNLIGKQDNHKLEIKIADTGPGIPHEVLIKLFEPFATSKEKGTGLGLAITKKIVTAHSGEITVDSFPGGTIFTLKFPISIGMHPGGNQ